MSIEGVRDEIRLAGNRTGMYKDLLGSDCEAESAALSHMANYSGQMVYLLGSSLPEELVRRARGYLDKRKEFWGKVLGDVLDEAAIPDGYRTVLEESRENEPHEAVANSRMPMDMAEGVLATCDGLLWGKYRSEWRELTEEAMQIHADYILFLDSLLPRDGV